MSITGRPELDQLKQFSSDASCSIIMSFPNRGNE